VQRLSPQELTTLGPAEPRRMSIDEIVTLSKQGVAPDEIIRRYVQTGTRLRLTPQQETDMRGRGVAPMVLDHIASHEIEARRTDRITADVDRAAATRPQVIYPGYSRPYYSPRVAPYGGYGWYPGGSGWYGGIGLGF
jgi:hypothetical protein